MSAREADPPSSLPTELVQLLADLEGEHLEFKEASTSYDEQKLARYCCALANEGGGKLVLGVTDARPRVVIGSAAYPQIERVRRTLMDRVPLNIAVRTLDADGKRVLIFDVPPRPIGTPMQVDGTYWSRNADSLVPMPADRLLAIFAESDTDFSARICPGLTMADLDAAAIEEFRRRWILKSGNDAFAALPLAQLLVDAEAIVDGGITYAALILFGTRAALRKHLAQSEVVFEYRANESPGPAQQRKEYHQGFFSWYDDLWETISLRNDLQHYQDGMFMYDIATVDERSVREAILNAAAHRDYQLAGNVFVRQFPRRIEIDSPGGFPRGITPENILDRQSPRNRRVAELFGKCGLVERSGQGMNLMFEQSIKKGKPRPDLSGSDQFLVRLILNGEVGDPRFVRAVEKIAAEAQSPIVTRDFLVLDLVHRDRPIPSDFTQSVSRLIEMGAVERIGRGRQSRLLLSRRFYEATGNRGGYTRRRGLDRETNKELLLRHLVMAGPEGSPIAELQQVLPSVSRKVLRGLLGELRTEGRADSRGKLRWMRWSAVTATMLPS